MQHVLVLFLEYIHWEVRLVLRVTFSLLSEKFETSTGIENKRKQFLTRGILQVSYYDSELFCASLLHKQIQNNLPSAGMDHHTYT